MMTKNLAAAESLSLSRTQGRREVSRRGRESWVGGQELQLLHTILKSANCRRVGHPLPSYGVLIKHTVDHTSIEVASRAFIISLPPIHARELVLRPEPL